MSAAEKENKRREEKRKEGRREGRAKGGIREKGREGGAGERKGEGKEEPEQWLVPFTRSILYPLGLAKVGLPGTGGTGGSIFWSYR